MEVAKDYQGVIFNTYHGGDVETGHHVIWLIPEDVANNFSFPNFITAVLGTLRGVLENDTTPRDKIYLTRLGMTEGKYGGASMVMKTGMEFTQDYTAFSYGPPSPYKYLNHQNIAMVAVPGVKTAPKTILPGNIKDKFRKEPPPYLLIIDNLETLLVTRVYKSCVNTVGSSVQSFIKPRASKSIWPPSIFSR